MSTERKQPTPDTDNSLPEEQPKPLFRFDTPGAGFDQSVWGNRKRPEGDDRHDG